MSVRELVLAIALSAFIASPALSEEQSKHDIENPIIRAIKNGRPLIDVRYRYAHKSQNGFAEDVYANTLRTQMGYEKGELYNLKFLVEFENVTSIGDDHFNSTANGLVQYPVIVDPDASEVNRAQMAFTEINKASITVCRQHVKFNEFKGAVYDGAGAFMDPNLV